LADFESLYFDAKVVQKKLLTVHNLDYKNIRVRNNCVFCNKHNGIHLFVHCLHINFIWEFGQDCCPIKGRPSSLKS